MCLKIYLKFQVDKYIYRLIISNCKNDYQTKVFITYYQKAHYNSQVF